MMASILRSVRLANTENISKSYVSRILRLALLAPDIIKIILTRRTDHTTILKRLERPLLESWQEQREQLASILAETVAAAHSQ
jgi:hypothetical protein